MTSAIYTLPVPPSLNHAYPTNSNGKRFVSKDCTVWRTQAAWELKQQKARPILGPVEIALVVREIKNADIDNRIKPVLDLLVAQGIIDGDHNKTVRKVSAAWGDVDRAQVEIRSAA